MHVSLRSLPDTTLATCLTAAYGRAVTCSASPLGTSAVLALPSGACLLARTVVAPAGVTLDLQAVTSPRTPTGRGVGLDALADLRLDLEILQVAGELVELYALGGLRSKQWDWALACAEAGDNDEEVTEHALAQVRALELDLGDGEVPAPGACFVELALALHSLRQTAIDNAVEDAVEVTAEEVIRV